MEIQTQSIHFNADNKLVDFIDKKVRKLEIYYDGIISADITLKLEKTGQVQDKIAELKLHVPGNTLVVKETKKSFEEAVDVGTNSLRRQLIRYKEKLSGK